MNKVVFRLSIDYLPDTRADDLAWYCFDDELKQQPEYGKLRNYNIESLVSS